MNKFRVNPNIQDLQPTVSHEVVSSFEEVTLTREEWDNFILSSDNDIYFSYDWCKIWWRHYGGERQLRILFFRHDNYLIGILPMIIDSFFFGLSRFKLAKLVGSDFTLSVLKVPILDAYAKQIFEIVLAQMYLVEKCDAIWFGPLSHKDQAVHTLRSLSKRVSSDLYIAHDKPISCHTELKLPNCFNDYLDSLHVKARRNYNAGKNRLNKSFKIAKHIIRNSEEVYNEFQNFIERHTVQWNSINKLGHFLDWPGAVEFHKDLVSTHAREDRVRLLSITADNKVVSSQYCYFFGKTNYFRLSSRENENNWGRFELGRVGFVNLVEFSIQEGINNIELGQGHYDYKLKLGASEYPLHSFLVTQNSLSKKVKVKIFLISSYCLNLIYYKIWFSRLAGKLPFLSRRPLWRIWIRTRM